MMYFINEVLLNNYHHNQHKLGDASSTITQYHDLYKESSVAPGVSIPELPTLDDGQQNFNIN